MMEALKKAEEELVLEGKEITDSMLINKMNRD